MLISPGRRKSILTRLAMIFAMPVTACAAPIYLHSPSLEKATAKASTSLPDQASALKPFDDQLAALTAFAAREDIAVAEYWTTVRESHFMNLIALDVETDRRHTLGRVIGTRLEELAGRQDVDPDLVRTRQSAIDARARADREADRRRQLYWESAPEDEQRELSCQAVTEALASRDPARLPAAAEPRRRYLRIGDACASWNSFDRRVAEAEARLDRMGGLIGAERAALRQAEEKTTYRPSPRIAELQTQIRQAATFAESGSASARLEILRTSLRELAEGASEATRALALDEAGKVLDELLRGAVCDSPAVTAEAKTEAGCGADTPTSTAGRARASWAFARALAQLADANAPDRRSANWLAAAKAIVAAEKADAELRLQQAQAEASAAGQRLAALLREMLHLATARQALLRPLAECHGGAPGGDRRPNPRCAFAAYVDAWNEGRIPAEILRYRPVQIQRSFAVRRSRAVAQRQYVLAASGAASLRDYGAGGIRAPEVAQAIADLAILGLIPGE